MWTAWETGMPQLIVSTANHSIDRAGSSQSGRQHAHVGHSMRPDWFGTSRLPMQSSLTTTTEKCLKTPSQLENFDRISRRRSSTIAEHVIYSISSTDQQIRELYPLIPQIF